MQAHQDILKPEHWVDLYADELFSYAYSKTGKEPLSQDLVQDTFLSALNARNNFHGNSSEKTWLYAILKNKIADHYKKASTRYEVAVGKSEADPTSAFFTNDEEWAPDYTPQTWDTSMPNILEEQEFQNTLNQCLGKLPEALNRIIRLKWMEDKESTEICKELGITSSNLWTMAHRAKLQLRACLEKNWFTTP